MQGLHFQVDVFNCQQILTQIYFVIFDIVVKNKLNVVRSVVRTLTDNDRRHQSGQNLLWTHEAQNLLSTTNFDREQILTENFCSYRKKDLIAEVIAEWIRRLL